MKLTTKLLKKLIKEEMDTMGSPFDDGSTPYSPQHQGGPEDEGVEKDENGNLIYYRSKEGILWPKPQSPEDEKVIMAPIA